MKRAGLDTPEGKATASLALGATSVLCAWFSGIPGIVLGVLALRALPKAPEGRVARRKAIAGIAVAAASMACWCPVSVVFALAQGGAAFGGRAGGSAAATDDGVAGRARGAFQAEAPDALKAIDTLAKIEPILSAPLVLFEDPESGRGGAVSSRIPLAALEQSLTESDPDGWSRWRKLGIEIRAARRAVRAPGQEGTVPTPSGFDALRAELAKAIAALRAVPGIGQPGTPAVQELEARARRYHLEAPRAERAWEKAASRAFAPFSGQGSLIRQVTSKRYDSRDDARFMPLEQHLMRGVPLAAGPEALDPWAEETTKLLTGTGDADLNAAADQLRGALAEVEPARKGVAEVRALRADVACRALGLLDEVAGALPGLAGEWDAAWRAVAERLARIEKAKDELLAAEESRPPEPAGLTAVSGTTYRVVGDDFYLASSSRSRVVTIPARYRGLFVEQRSDDPSRQHVSGKFLHAGERQGVNALGGVVVAQAFKVDPGYAADVAAYREWRAANGALLEAARGLPPVANTLASEVTAESLAALRGGLEKAQSAAD